LWHQGDLGRGKRVMNRRGGTLKGRIILRGGGCKNYDEGKEAKWEITAGSSLEI